MNSTSKSNIHEAIFVAQTVFYLLKNGSKESEITVLTFYLGQHKLLRDEIRKTVMHPFDSSLINVQTVDNFQGKV